MAERKEATLEAASAVWPYLDLGWVKTARLPYRPRLQNNRPERVGQNGRAARMVRALSDHLARHRFVDLAHLVEENPLHEIPIRRARRHEVSPRHAPYLPLLYAVEVGYSTTRE